MGSPGRVYGVCVRSRIVGRLVAVRSVARLAVDQVSPVLVQRPIILKVELGPDTQRGAQKIRRLYRMVVPPVPQIVLGRGRYVDRVDGRSRHQPLGDVAMYVPGRPR